MADYRPEVKRIIKALRIQGWRIEQGVSMHYKCFPPDRTKSMVTLSATPSDHHAIPKMKRDLRRSGATFKYKNGR